MSNERNIDLLNDLLSNGAEQSWLEFKRNQDAPEMIGKLCSAISNAARVEGRDVGYVVWGIDDTSRNVVGTNFSPVTQRVGNQEFLLWLAKLLQPSIAFRFHEITHPAGRVVLLEIPAATTAPTIFENLPYIRIGSATPKLTDYPERYQRLLECLRPFTWEHGIAKQYVAADDVLKLLDYPQYFRLMQKTLPDRAVIFEHLGMDRLIVKDVADKWNITNLGAILFANDLNDFDASLARKGIRFAAYNGKNRAAMVTHRHDGRKGYASGFEGLVTYINNLLPINEHIGSALREEHRLFPELALRELIANALIHQDMTISGAGPLIELFVDRIEITNPGRPLVKTERMFDLPPRSRNEQLAGMMRRMRLCEEHGTGLDKVLERIELYQLPPLLLHESESAFQATLYAPRGFASMTREERIRACEQHAILKYISGERMKNSTLCERFGIDKKNAAQASTVINHTLEAKLIKPADPDHPRAGYIPAWA